ncbi:mechanosensitive ion channel family protein [Atopobacter sp. AH10]|uniref:mechanosensitive ion channel family protein n=1 Tax=Atopobacter sp. AH10 TaxID=2315861 RepID=UPI000EF27349|nr:mechanosensitive ion channel family protein [Atopobacter sp. AH10]RLK63967.1 mechanosensitive ion channel family protein [Atopobacter sp. AH10]
MSQFLQHIHETIQAYFSLNWPSLFVKLSLKVIGALVFILICFILRYLARLLVRKTFIEFPGRPIEQTNRITTIVHLLNNIIQYVFYFFLLYGLLSILGLPVSSLLAGASIAGIAIGLGAQGFLTDVVNGFFILLEHQYDVGDEVVISSINGIVSSIGLRSTQIQDFDGVTHYIPNRQILIVSNKSQHEMRITIDIPIYPDSPIDRIRSIIKKSNQELPLEIRQALTQPLKQIGVLFTNDSALIYRITSFSRAGDQYTLQSFLLERYMKALSQEGIALPKLTLGDRLK